MVNRVQLNKLVASKAQRNKRGNKRGNKLVRSNRLDNQRLMRLNKLLNKRLLSRLRVRLRRRLARLTVLKIAPFQQVVARRRARLIFCATARARQHSKLFMSWLYAPLIPRHASHKGIQIKVNVVIPLMV